MTMDIQLIFDYLRDAADYYARWDAEERRVIDELKADGWADPEGSDYVINTVGDNLEHPDDLAKYSSLEPIHWELMEVGLFLHRQTCPDHK